MVSLFIFDDSRIKAENKLKNFITTPNMQDENHRKKFVALSRARDYLYIIVPELSEENEGLLSQTNLFEIIRLD